MKLIATLILMLATTLPSWGAQVFPATTNRSQTLYGTNTFATNTILGAAILMNEVPRPGLSPSNSIYMWTEDVGGLPALRVRDWNGLVLGVVRDNVWIGRCAQPGGISKGDAVYVAGTANTNMAWIAKAQANDRATMPAVGLAVEDISFLAAGRVLNNGLIPDVDTTNWLTGDTLYVSDSVAGGLTNVIPIVPNIMQQMGFVQIPDTNGSIQVEIGAILNDATGTGQTNWYFGPYTTNVLSYGGSQINGVGITNGTVYATNFVGLGQVLTNGHSVAVTFSNNVTVDATHTFVASSGSVGGWTYNATTLYRGSIGMASTGIGVSSGSPIGYWSAAGGAIATGIKPYSTGIVDILTNANVYGSITATNGLILPGTNSYIKFNPRVTTVEQITAITTNLNTAYIYSLTNDAGAELYGLDGGGTHSLLTPHADDAPASMYDLTDPFPAVTREHNIYLGVIRWINKSRQARVAEAVIELNANSYEAWLGIQAGSNVGLLKNNNVWQTNRVNWANSDMGTNWYLTMKDFVLASKDGRTVMATETYDQYNQRMGLTNGNGLKQVSWTSVQTALSNEVYTAYANAVAAYEAAVAAGDTNAVPPGPYVPRETEPVPTWLYNRGVR